MAVTTPEGMGFACLPYELVLAILELASVPPPRSFRVSPNRRARTLHTLALVGRAFRAPAQSLLWRDLLVYSARQLELVQASPLFGVHRTARLVVVLPKTPDNALVSVDALVNGLWGLHELDITRAEMREGVLSSKACRELTKLCLNDVSLLPTTPPAEPATAFPHLVHLELNLRTPVASVLPRLLSSSRALSTLAIRTGFTYRNGDPSELADVILSSLESVPSVRNTLTSLDLPLAFTHTPSLCAFAALASFSTSTDFFYNGTDPPLAPEHVFPPNLKHLTVSMGNAALSPVLHVLERILLSRQDPMWETLKFGMALSRTSLVRMGGTLTAAQSLLDVCHGAGVTVKYARDP